MDRNSIIGLVLMGAILLGFSWYNQGQQEEILKEKARIDSIALASAPVSSQDTSFGANGTTDYDTTLPTTCEFGLDSTLLSAARGSEKTYTLENDKMIVTLSNKGAAIVSVELKDFTTFDGKPLMLFNEEGSRFDMSFYLKQVINSGDFYFTATSVTSNSIAMRLPVAEGSYIEFAYALENESNMVDFKVNMVGMDNQIASSQRTLDINWSNIAPQQEKGYEYESNYVTAAYRFPGEDSVEELSMGTSEEEDVDSKVEWIGFKQQFFSSIFVAKDDFTSTSISYKALPEGSGSIKQFFSESSVDYSPNQSSYEFLFFFGPNDYNLMSSYDLEFQKLIPLGSWIIGWINRIVIIPTFNFLSQYIANYGWIIFLLTILIKLVLFPFTYKSYRSMAKMRLIKPEVDAINEKYPNKEDALKKQQATMELYGRAGVSPMGGCLPMLLQFPVLIAMFRFFPASIELRGEHFLWATDLSSYDSILNLPFDIPFYGNHVSLFALLMGVSMFFSTKISQANSPSQSNAALPGMTFMTTYLMPIMLIVWFNSYSSALSYYYLLSNLITIGQTVIMRRFVDDKKLHEQMKQNAKKGRKKSKWQQRYDDMLKQQQELQRNKK